MAHLSKSDADDSPMKKALRKEADKVKYKAVGGALMAAYEALERGDEAEAGEAFCLALEMERGY